jgi:hypothetical protein
MKLSNSRHFAIDRVYTENKRMMTEYLTLHQTTVPWKLSVLSLRYYVLSALEHFYFCRDLHIKTLFNNTYNTSGYTHTYNLFNTTDCPMWTSDTNKEIRHCFSATHRVMFYNLLPCPTRLNSHQLQNIQYTYYFFSALPLILPSHYSIQLNRILCELFDKSQAVALWYLFHASQ